MSYAIVDAQPGHVHMLLEVLREQDVKECLAFGLTPRRALWRSFRTSFIRKAAFFDGEIVAMWGIGGTALGETGHMWLLTGNAIENSPIRFVKEAQRELDEALELFPRVSGILSLEYAQAVRLVKLLGFSLVPLDPPFAMFEKVREYGR